MRQTFSHRENLAGKPAIFQWQACHFSMAGADWMRRFAFLFHNNYNLKNGKKQDIFEKNWGKKYGNKFFK